MKKLAKPREQFMASNDISCIAYIAELNSKMKSRTSADYIQ